MKFKKRIIPMIAGTLTAILLTSTASAHDGDVLGGKYIGKSGANILLRICESAQTSLLTKDGVYEGCFDWNGISSNANVRMAWAVTGMPSLKDEMLVVGDPLLGNTGGQTAFYDSNGNQISENGDCAYAVIVMNTSSNSYDNFEDKKLCARKVFVREVGHVLKLSHPERNLRLPGHTNYAYGGVPYAVMNQYPPIEDYPFVSPTVASHDRSCLIAKWGA